MGVFQRLNVEGMTVIMVTHELDIASFAKRNVIMRDGQIVSDKLVAKLLNSETELNRLRDEQKAVKLSV